MEVANAAGGQVVGAASIVDRSPSTSSGQALGGVDVPYVALLELALPIYEPDKCPLCAQGMPVVKPGSRV
jgi:orotate phosphoribosyltransferase